MLLNSGSMGGNSLISTYSVQLTRLDTGILEASIADSSIGMIGDVVSLIVWDCVTTGGINNDDA